jgi:hypothetical protein
LNPSSTTTTAPVSSAVAASTNVGTTTTTTTPNIQPPIDAENQHAPKKRIRHQYSQEVIVEGKRTRRNINFLNVPHHMPDPSRSDRTKNVWIRKIMSHKKNMDRLHKKHNTQLKRLTKKILKIEKELEEKNITSIRESLKSIGSRLCKHASKEKKLSEIIKAAMEAYEVEKIPYDFAYKAYRTYFEAWKVGMYRRVYDFHISFIYQIAHTLFVAKCIDKSYRGLNLSSLNAFRDLLQLDRYERGLIPCHTTVERAQNKLEQKMQTVVPYTIEYNQEMKCEVGSFDYRKLLKFIIVHHGLHDYALRGREQDEAIAIAITCDGARYVGSMNTYISFLSSTTHSVCMMNQVLLMVSTM